MPGFSSNARKNKTYLVKGVVQIFPMENPWVYVPVPKEYTLATQHLANRGLVPILVTLGETTWKTSLMPKGDGTQFIPLSKKIRIAEGISVGDTIKLDFSLREDWS